MLLIFSAVRIHTNVLKFIISTIAVLGMEHQGFVHARQKRYCLSRWPSLRTAFCKSNLENLAVLVLGHSS